MPTTRRQATSSRDPSTWLPGFSIWVSTSIDRVAQTVCPEEAFLAPHAPYLRHAGSAGGSSRWAASDEEQPMRVLEDVAKRTEARSGGQTGAGTEKMQTGNRFASICAETLCALATRHEALLGRLIRTVSSRIGSPRTVLDGVRDRTESGCGRGRAPLPPLPSALTSAHSTPGSPRREHCSAGGFHLRLHAFQGPSESELFCHIQFLFAHSANPARKRVVVHGRRHRRVLGGWRGARLRTGSCRFRISPLLHGTGDLTATLIDCRHLLL